MFVVPRTTGGTRTEIICDVGVIRIVRAMTVLGLTSGVAVFGLMY